MDQEAILAKIQEAIPPALEATLRDGRVIVFYRTPDEWSANNVFWSANTVFTQRFLQNQAQLMASHVQEGQTLEVQYSHEGRWPEITFTVS
jgi:hypothetical protein